MTDTPETDNLARGNHVVPTEFAEQLERERDRAIELLREIRDDEINAQDEADKFLRDHMPSKLSQVTEQRDRLAEALYPFSRMMGGHTYLGYEYVKKAGAALQSLTPNEP